VGPGPGLVSTADGGASLVGPCSGERRRAELPPAALAPSLGAPRAGSWPGRLLTARAGGP